MREGEIVVFAMDKIRFHEGEIERYEAMLLQDVFDTLQGFRRIYWDGDVMACAAGAGCGVVVDRFACPSRSPSAKYSAGIGSSNTAQSMGSFPRRWSFDG